MFSAVTISLVPELKGGPFIFWDGLAESIHEAAKVGFDAVEIFPPHGGAIDIPILRDELQKHNLKLAAMGTGAGYALRKLSLTTPSRRGQAEEFIRTIIDIAGEFNAPAIVGSMQGRWGDGATKDEAYKMLGESLAKLGDHAAKRGTFLLYEHLNRYETNLCNTCGAAVELLQTAGAANVKVLADLFHMNIEERSVPDAIRSLGDRLGHVHFADSNRQAAGLGHTDFAPIVAALKEVGYAGALSAEVFALPDSLAAAEQTLASYKRFVA